MLSLVSRGFTNAAKLLVTCLSIDVFVNVAAVDVTRLSCDDVLVKVAPFSVNMKTALHLAASNGECSMVEFLIQLPYIDVNYIDRIGRTPLRVAASAGHHNVVGVLLGVM